ncbi:MAG TPA: Co2+/Mg2+ efflux protein ApaG [Deltaproteobacteria bacterium]|nr:Co2+/Mg2+ efflux protein ApaG [Deltaproteobacteria bacterium]
MSQAITRGIKVEVESEYMEEESFPEKDYYMFTYNVIITNTGDQTVQLINRHWIITNAGGKMEEVRGPGVVGLQPKLVPGEVFEYSSFCPLDTGVGTMHGSYQMMSDDGDEFSVAIAPFVLSVPGMLH